MPFPLIPVLIGAGIGAMAGGMSGEDGWDWKRAFGGALLGGATGGVGAAAMAPAAAATSGASAGALGGAGIAGIQSGGAATMASGLGAGVVGGGGLGGSTAAGLSGISGGAAYKPLSYGMGQQAATSAQAGSPLLKGQALMRGLQGGGIQPSSVAVPSADPSMVSGKGFDYGQLGDTLQSMGGEAQQESPNSFPDPAPLQVGQGRGSDSVTTDLERERQAIQGSIPTSGATGLSDVERAAKGGIATKFGMMKTPSGSLTGGEIVGPGTGTSDTIRSAIYPDLASKLGASSMQALQGGGHQVQKAALSDGEFVLTAKAVEGLGKNANAPPGQEREYGSKLLDQAMNQWQRI